MRVFLPDEPERDAPVIVCTELANNPGQSVTNAAPRIAAEVLSACFAKFRSARNKS